MIVPEMIAPFYVICAAHSQSDFASVWSPYHTFRPHLAESTFAPVNFVSLASNRKRDVDWRQTLIIDENAIPEYVHFCATALINDLSVDSVEAIVRKNADLVKKLRNETLQRCQQRLKEWG